MGARDYMESSSLLVQQKKAHLVLGVSQSTFWRHIRPELPQCRKGGSVYYRRVDLEQWIDESMGGCDRSHNLLKGKELWESENQSQGSMSELGFGTLINKSTKGGYIEQLEQLIAKRQNKS
jgi:predicted DNA-binding transcriptional regulator AlpA